ncbi:halocyanin domain-containing protein [Halorarius halobius]|uniref:halocyanin domain-containing protein n=1 Tax=Halorarius halobius TaxID=2962671 RepID=UPI0020CF7AB6|nr:halocyanin domain-containing protein [Halorarius halobius]
MHETSFGRRGFLKASGSAALLASVAGCTGTGGGNGGNSPTSGSDGSPADRVAAFLNADPAAGNFEGTVVDETGTDEVVVEVGASGNGGNFAYAPAAVRIDAGTTVSWQWTGKGSLHNVESVASDSFEGEFQSDFDFTSGDPKESGDPYEQSFDDAGVALYFCGPHKSLGMKGGIVVE